MHTSALCPCCDKPLANVANIEPYFEVPDVIHQMRKHRPREAERSCKTSSDICSINWDNETGTGRAYLRCVIPIDLHDRPDDPFKWGVWVELSRRDDLFRIIDLWSDEAQVEEPPFEVMLANELNGPLAFAAKPSTSVRTILSTPPPPSLGARGLMRLTGPKTRPQFYFDDSVEHVIAKSQREGATLKDTFNWTRFWHSLAMN